VPSRVSDGPSSGAVENLVLYGAAPGDATLSDEAIIDEAMVRATPSRLRDDRLTSIVLHDIRRIDDRDSMSEASRESDPAHVAMRAELARSRVRDTHSSIGSRRMCARVVTR
jgi:hypothetical protein